MTMLDDNVPTARCADCTTEFAVVAMRPGVRDGLPIFRCLLCYKDFLLGEERNEAHWAEANQRAEESVGRDLVKENVKNLATARLFKAAFESADMEAVADELITLFNGNKGIAQALFAQWVHAAAAKPGGRVANDCMKLVMHAIGFATARRPQKSIVGEMTDEELAEELRNKPAILQISQEAAS